MCLKLLRLRRQEKELSDHKRLHLQESLPRTETPNESKWLSTLTFDGSEHLSASHFDLGKIAILSEIRLGHLVDSALTSDTPVRLTNAG